MQTNLNSKYINNILNVFEIGYIVSNFDLRSQNNPQISVKDAQILIAIFLLSDKNDNKFSVLNKYLANQPSVLSVAIKTLEKKGYIQKFKSETDAREVYLKLTSRSLKVFAHQTNLQKSLLGKSLQEVSNKDKQRIEKAIDAILESIDNNLQKFEKNKFSRLDYLNALSNDFLGIKYKEYAKLYALFNLFFVFKEKSIKHLKYKVSILELLMVKEIKRVTEIGRIASNKLLATIFKVDKSTISNTLAVLTSKGLVKRVIDPTNRRNIIIECTDKAKKMIEKIENYNYLALLPAYLANSAEDNATLDDLVNIMLSKLTQQEVYNLEINP
jgi:DNA-binding MarR family transcriptional regulator